LRWFHPRAYLVVKVPRQPRVIRHLPE